MNRATRVIHFLDHGQDFLRWYVDDDGVVVDCEPFQAFVWNGVRVTNLAELVPGAQVMVAMPWGIRPVNYRVRKVWPCDHEPDNELPPCIGEAMRDTTHGIYHRAANRED